MGIPATKGTLKTKIEDMDIGDYIPASYTSGASGALNTAVLISDIGVPFTSEIPVAGNAVSTKEGFYFIKVDEGLLVADRIIQHTITWNTLHSGKVIQGLPWSLPNIIPVMTSNTSADGNAFSDSVYTDAAEYASWKAFDGTATGNWTSATTAFPHHIGYEFAQPKVIQGYSITSRNRDANDLTGAPKDWEFQAWDGAAWITLDKRNNISFASKGEKKIFAVRNKTAYTKYRVLASSNNGYSATTVTIGELEMYEKVGTVRSLGGGNSYVDANGNSSKNDASLGAWPTNNEWDSLIAKFPLNLIQDGKTLDDVFHWSVAGTWCYETPITGFLAGTTAATNTGRIIRGKYSENQVNEKGVGFGESATAYAVVGFRPVFQYIE